MYLLQGLIVFAVVGSNIHWQWTPNPYIPPMFGFILAYAVTWLIVEFRDRWRRFGWSKRLIFPGRQSFCTRGANDTRGYKKKPQRWAGALVAWIGC